MSENLLVIKDVSHNANILGVVISVLGAVILYNILQLVLSRSRVKKLEEAKTLIEEGYERRLSGNPIPPVDKDLVNKEIRKTEEKIKSGEKPKKEKKKKKEKEMKDAVPKVSRRQKKAEAAYDEAQRQIDEMYESLDKIDRIEAAIKPVLDDIAANEEEA